MSIRGPEPAQDEGVQSSPSRASGAGDEWAVYRRAQLGTKRGDLIVGLAPPGQLTS